jgi:hypothetical protein
MAHDAELARRAWELLEPVHDVVYFAPGLRDCTDAAGLRGFFMAYFAMRAAPLGAVNHETVTATFFGFHRSRVQRAIPEAWHRMAPEAALRLRTRWVDSALRRLLGEAVIGSGAVAEAADLAWAAAQACDVAGRPLAAGNQAMLRPAAPHLALWQAATTIREHRGDGHIAVLVAQGVSPAQAHLLKAGAGEADGDVLRAGRGFPDDEWQAARDQLIGTGWLDAAGQLSDTGWAAHRDIERWTDTAAAAPWAALGRARTERLLELVRPPTESVYLSGIIPQPSPTGLVTGAR